MAKPEIVFDSSTIIAVSNSCIINILGALRKSTGAGFVIPSGVEYETVTRPVAIKKFELNAVRIRRAIGSGVFEVDRQNLSSLNEKIAGLANNSFFAGSNPIELIQLGEIESLSLILKRKAKALAIDERTARMLVEDPKGLKSLMEKRHGVRLSADWQKLDELREMFSGITIVRSTELVAMAFRRGLFQPELEQSRQGLEAALFAVKFNGCAVTTPEIEKFVAGAK
ncbi:MAG: hypothetical protein HY394_04900 [Candidatus Diapherotrites archaeon]|nr:hypothetical protein [Candidatus Diapherotrites archaeon]